jgi:hypothetical protein
MTESLTLLALFADIDPAAAAVERLREMGISQGEMNVISGVPIAGRILGRPSPRTRVPQIAIGGALLGVLLGLFFIYGIPYLYPLPVGGQPLFPIPQGAIAVYEMMTLALMSFAFLGMFVDSGLPSYSPKDYVPAISDGKIAVLFGCKPDEEQRFTRELQKLGAESVEHAEARVL